MKIRICFTGGGTAGHVYPGIAVINSTSDLCRRNNIDTDFFWIGAETGMEKMLVKAQGIDFKGIATGKFRRYFSLKNITDIFRIITGIIQSFIILIKEKPDLIFSKGGYVSVPPVFAGWILGIPVVSHESDYTPGLATKINCRFSKAVYLSFYDSSDFFSQKYKSRISITGNPVRSIFINSDSEKGKNFIGLEEDIPVILVLGGSQGAREINQLIEAIAPELTKKYCLIHQFGAINLDKLSDPENNSKRYKKYPYFGDELADILAASTLVVSRAGAGTIWEIAAVEKPVILIPLRGSGTRGDQVFNADFLYSKGAAEKIDDISIDPQLLYSKIIDIIENSDKKKKMISALKLFGIEKSAEIIAESILKKAGAGIE